MGPGNGPEGTGPPFRRVHGDLSVDVFQGLLSTFEDDLTETTDLPCTSFPWGYGHSAPSLRSLTTPKLERTRDPNVVFTGGSGRGCPTQVSCGLGQVLVGFPQPPETSPTRQIVTVTVRRGSVRLIQSEGASTSGLGLVLLVRPRTPCRSNGR